jgi:CheY-like chemotaxis protein
MRVSAAGSAAEAIELLRRDRPDVLVSDIAMPEQDGYALIRHVRGLPAEEGGLTPAIALTAYARDEDRRRALDAGFQRHLIKPVEPGDLAAAVADQAGGPAAEPEPLKLKFG